MQVSEALDRLVSMLVEAGIDPERPGVWELWAVMKEFALILAEGCSESLGTQLLYECGPYGFEIAGDREFKLRFVRQYMIEQLVDDPDLISSPFVDVCFNQVCCDFFYLPTDELKAIRKLSIWSQDYPDLITFASIVEQHQAFQRVPTMYEPWRVRIYQTDWFE